MSICASGISQPKPGRGGTIAVTPVYMGSVTDFPSWIQPYLPYLSVVTLNIDTLCASDPPAVGSVPTSDVWGGLLQGVFSPTQAIQLFVESLLSNAIWYQQCQCSAGAQPTLPTYPGPPTGLPAINPPASVTPPPNAPCLTFTSGPLTLTAGQSFNRSGPAFDTVAASFIGLTPKTSVVSAPGPRVIFQIQQLTSGGTVVRTDTFNVANSDPGTLHVQAVYPGATQALVVETAQSGIGGSTSASFECDVYCNGQTPGGTNNPCCPPDPFLEGRLDLILNMVTLLQRQIAPFGYVPGANHSALTGHGSFAVAGLLGVRVTLVDYGAGVVGVEAGTPESLFEIGWINWGTADGWILRERITAVDFISTPRDAGMFTVVGYSLNATVECDILELVREP